MTADINLDPSDWAATRRLAHRMIDDMIDLQASAFDGPVWQTPDPESVKRLQAPAPITGTSLDRIYSDFRADIQPYTLGNRHPRFFGWAVGNGTVEGMLADLLTSGINVTMSGFNQSPIEVESSVLRWLAEAYGFPPDSGGLLVGGGTMANLNALAVARQKMAGWDVRHEGLARSAPLRVYGSAETHSWILKACNLMGLGQAAFQSVPVDDEFRIDIPTCRAMIQHDIEAGHIPFCVVGNAGTTNTGSVDDLLGLRKLADEFGLWFHVDGALGSLAAVSPEYADLVQGQSKADSLAFDLHKWGYLPYEIAGVLIRDPDASIETFAVKPAYLAQTQRGVSTHPTIFADRGVELSRSFRALKAWTSLRHHGIAGIGEVISKNIRQVRQLAKIIEETDGLESLSPVGVNVVNFRYVDPECPEAQLDELNQEIILRLYETGIAVPSPTTVRGRTAIRVCIVNHRTRDQDLGILVDAVCRLGREILMEGRFAATARAPA